VRLDPRAADPHHSRNYATGEQHMSSRRITWTTADIVEDIGYGGRYPVEVGRDHDGEYVAVVTREGMEFRARLAAIA
jgi:hypothetical protein